MVKTVLSAALMIAGLGGGLRAAGRWTVELVDTSGPGKYSSMKIDSRGNVHVAYVIDDGNRYPLKYAFWDHQLGRWFIMPVAEGSGPCSLALDSQQRPHIAYNDAGTGSGAKLRHAYWNGKEWVKEAIPLNSDIVSYYDSIVLDSQDRPSISFYEYRGPRDTEFKIRMRVVSWNGKFWEVRTVDPEEGSGKFNSLAVDAKGHLHLAYANVSAVTAGLRYGFWDGQSWKTQVVDGPEKNGGDSVGYSVRLALDRDGNPHIAYMNESTPTLKYAVRKNGTWSIEAVDRLGAVGYPDRDGITLNEQGEPYISYFDAGRGLLKLAHRENHRWMGEVIDGNGAGSNSSVQIGGGSIWISYADGSAGALKVAHRQLTEEPEASQISAGNPVRRATP